MSDEQVFTADYTGEPGHRTFYLQHRSGVDVASYLVEKQQVALLADKLRELLVAIDRSDSVVRAEPTRDPALALTEPLEPAWRVGAMGLSYDEDQEKVLVFLAPVREEDEEDEDDAERFEVRVSLRRDQARSFVLHALAVVAEGRPTCQLCGLPIDPEGHACPASNGHRPAR